MEALKRLKSFTLFVTLIFSLSGFARDIVLISDLDDTIKITETHKTLRMAYNALFSTKVFVAMPELIEHMQSYIVHTTVLTSSPTLLRKRVKKTLSKNNVPYNELILRRLKKDNKHTYKFENIEKILANYPDADVIFMGDDSGEDHNIYHEVKAKYGDRVLATYIRPVRNRAQLPGQIRYFTAFDIALNEYNAGRLAYIELRDIAYLVSDHRKSREVIPKTFYCPDGFSTSDTGVEDLIDDVRKKVAKVCGRK
jgi:hypothetical protein